MALLPSPTPPNSQFPNPNFNALFFLHPHTPSSFHPKPHKSSFPFIISQNSNHQHSKPHFSQTPPKATLKLHPTLVHVAASTLLFIGFSAKACSIGSGEVPVLPDSNSWVVQEERIVETVDENDVTGTSAIGEDVEDKELKAKFEKWKSKTYALTVPLRIVALRGSIPPTWIKDFVQSQGSFLKLRSEFRGNLNDIYSDLSLSSVKGIVQTKSAMAADVVTVGDSWLNLFISQGVIEPMQGIEGQDWFKGLSEKWKGYLRRNSKGELDLNGEIWAAPYRWGSIVIAYKKSKFQKCNMAPIEDWKDLWRPELSGKIAMVDSPREVLGAILKYMGASYNTKDIAQVSGGREAVLRNLILLQKQVRMFDSLYYLKAFGVGDVWVAVGWSSDILPAAKRMSDVAVIVPKSGASLWADLWAIPAASRFASKRNGGRFRGPSPLVHQWIEFCLQAARALPFKQEVVPGASPSSLEVNSPFEASHDLLPSKDNEPNFDTNLISGVPPPEILAKCEFLEPLSEASLNDYKWMLANMQKPRNGLIQNLQFHVVSMVQSLFSKVRSKGS
ncbi:hypothetical protein GIB67_012186 [Kingdonia uniflora]|uniref:Uncharacterized protein n=1 Tax=Kingdonia uniflora TaxID=39325 RepID=A0A7J7NPD6_9MAGN|nr:hypothetical protein GIB67_012186 [Kingdonia uniflora]